MQARVFVFPVKGRSWCFLHPRASAAVVASSGGDGALPPPPTLKDLWRGISSAERTTPEKAEAVVDFVADKVLGGAHRQAAPPSFTCIWVSRGFLMA
jgi:hypothetical protein